MYDGTLLFMQSSFAALTFPQKHERETASTSFTVTVKDKTKYFKNLKPKTKIEMFLSEKMDFF